MDVDSLVVVMDGTRQISPVFGVTLFTRSLLTAKAVGACFERFRSLCPDDELVHYACGKSRKHRRAGKSTLARITNLMTPSRFGEVVVELRNGPTPMDAPTYKFLAFGFDSKHHNRKVDANLLSLAFPLAWSVAHAAELRALVVELCSVFPYRSGLAGFALECGLDNPSHRAAWKASLDHRGLDIQLPELDVRFVAGDAIKGVNWLTVLDTRFVDQLGGRGKLRKRLSKAILLEDLPGGVLIQAGSAPTLDEVAPYEEVYGVLEPLLAPGFERAGSMNLWEDSAGKTERWQRRLERQVPLPPPPLLAQIIASPDDDGPRLAYADWLTERGEVLGELIVIQCKLARKADAALRKRELALLAANERWLRMPYPLADGRLDRGFVTSAAVIRYYEPAVVAELPQLLAQFPLLRELRAADPEPLGKAIATTPYATQLRVVAATV